MNKCLLISISICMLFTSAYAVTMDESSRKAAAATDAMTQDEIDSILRGEESLYFMRTIRATQEAKRKEEERKDRIVRAILGVALIGVGIADILQDDAVSTFSGMGMTVLGYGMLTYKF